MNARTAATRTKTEQLVHQSARANAAGVEASLMAVSAQANPATPTASTTNARFAGLRAMFHPDDEMNGRKGEARGRDECTQDRGPTQIVSLQG